MPDERVPLPPIWQLLITIITSITTIVVSYFAAVRPATQATVQDQIEKREQQLAQGVPVAINSAPIQNDSGYRLLIIGFCNATRESKQIEALIGQSEDKMKLVASESGTDRLTITCVVPRSWFYR